jgi:hypothetical protein
MKAKVATMLLVGAFVSSFSMLSQPASAAIPFCLPGSSSGHCNGPKGIAVETETGDVYVADSGNKRIDVFDSGGTTLNSFGAPQSTNPIRIAVDNSAASPTRNDVYVGNVNNETEDFEVTRYGPSGAFLNAIGSTGSGTCQFGHTTQGVTDSIAVGPEGDLYVADRLEAGGGENYKTRIEHFEADGTCIGEVTLFEGHQLAVQALALDSSGALYVAIEGGAGEGGVIRKYSPAGTLLANFGGVETESLALDTSGHLFGKQRGATVGVNGTTYFIAEYSLSGTLLRRFDYAIGGGHELPVPGLAAGEASGTAGVYTSKGEAGIDFAAIGSGPEVISTPCHVTADGLGSTHATLTAEINPEGKGTEFHFVYGAGAESLTSPSASLAQGASDFELHEATLTLTGLEPETSYHCQVIAENSDGTGTGAEGSFETRESFELIQGFASKVEELEATLSVEVNPLGSEAKGQFEYVEDGKFQESGFAEAQLAPAEPVDFGAGEAPELESIVLPELRPSTVYHWRLRVVNTSHPEGIICPRAEDPPCPAYEHTFRTFGESEMADDRHWELVSPNQKGNAEVGTPGIASGVFEPQNPRINAGAASGELITYTSFTAFGPESQGAPQTSQYLSHRTPEGWVTEDITPFGPQFPAQLPFKGFGPELNVAAFKVDGAADAPGCSEAGGGKSFYLRTTATGAVDCLSVDGKGSAGCFLLGGASTDGSRIFFATEESLGGAPAGPGFNLYEWSAGGGLKTISILPGGELPTTPIAGTTFGPTTGSNLTNCSIGYTTMKHVVSADGSKAFWTYQPPSRTENTRLLAYVAEGETVQLDALPSQQKKEKPGGGPSGEGKFSAANASGSLVYFTDTGKLIRGASAEPGAPDLYRYDFENPEPLSDLTKGSSEADVEGLVGISEDGTYVYFVAKGNLTGGEEGSTGEVAAAGSNNFYVYHEGVTRFIARLAGSDSGDWESQPSGLTARVAPDGLHVAFLSVEATALAGFNNAIAKGGHCEYEPILDELRGAASCAQAFIYDAERDTVTCASCNPSGSRPLGPTLLPGWQNQFEGPRYLAESGSRLFFETYDRLSPSDENGLRDVYEFEFAGTGSCSGASDAYDPASGGCHYLISSGKDADESYLIDASRTGRDVLFSTRARLVGWDTNNTFDIYDYREGGGFPEPVEPAACNGEACRGAASSAAPEPQPATTVPLAESPACRRKRAKHHHHHHHRRRHGHHGKQKHGGSGRGAHAGHSHSKHHKCGHGGS